MSTAVSSSTLNLPASSTAANSDFSRNATNGTLNLSFSDLLNTQSGINARTPIPLMDTRPAPAPAPTHTQSPPSREIPREVSRPASTSQVPRPSQEPARVNGQDNVPETGQTAKTPPPQQGGANKPTDGNEEQGTSEGIAQNKRPLQPQLTDVTISPELPATVAALLNGIATPPSGDAPTTEASEGTPTHGHPRHPDTSNSLSVRAAAIANQGTQADAESNTDNDSGTNPNASALLTGRTPKNASTSAAPISQGQALATSGTGNEPQARINVSDIASVIPLVPRENGGARAVAPGTTPSAVDISMLNPPRLPTQAGASLPQFTIPSGAGQRAWAEEVGNRVMWMLGRAESRAELILTPPLLGKVEVSIHLNGDQSTAQFLASSQSAREALEQAMPRLRELLAQAGISLGEASVNTSAEEQAHENTKHAHTSGFHDDGSDGDGTVITAPNWSKLNSGIINTFA